MVIVLTTPIGSGHIHGLVKRFDRSAGRYLVEMTYADFVARGRAPRATAYLFTDVQRMAPPFLRAAVEIWRQLESAGGVRLFSNPAGQLGRFPLLRKLWEEGVNRFNVYPGEELESPDIRFPVFLRLENDHSGPKSGLIGDRSSLLRERDRLVLAGADPRMLLAVEFLDTADAQGIYRKYGAVRIGDLIQCQHILQSQDWNVKTDTRIRSDETVRQSDDFFESNPHVDLLRPIFERSGIEYGRIDYGMLDGRVQVWEINDNPVIAGSPWRVTGPYRMSNLDKGPTWFEAFRGLAEGVSGGPPIELDASQIAAAMAGPEIGYS